jgi:hypothetical protein
LHVGDGSKAKLKATAATTCCAWAISWEALQTPPLTQRGAVRAVNVPVAAGS